MVNWAIIVLIIIGLYVVYRTTGMRFGKTWTFLIWILVLFFIISFGYILTLPDVDVTNFDGLSDAIKIYFFWLGSFFDNAGTIAGQVVGTDWGGNFTSAK